MTTTAAILGVDPGATGALALLVPPATDLPLALTVLDMPVYEIVVGGRKRKRLDLHRLAAYFDLLPAGTRVLVEDVGPMPTDSARGAFSFGWAACAPTAMAVACGLTVLPPVRPQVWKAKFGLHDGDKDKARKVAREMLPSHAYLFDRVKDHGRAEATLIAIYGSKYA